MNSDIIIESVSTIYENLTLEKILNIFSKHQITNVVVTHNNDAHLEHDSGYKLLCKYNNWHYFSLYLNNYETLRQLFSSNREKLICFDATNLHNYEKNRIEKVKGNLGDTSIGEVLYEKLKSVEGDLFIPFVNSISFPSLQELGGCSIMPHVKSASFPSLQVLGSDLFAFRAKSISLPSLQVLGGHLYASRTGELDLSRSFPAERIVVSGKRYEVAKEIIGF